MYGGFTPGSGNNAHYSTGQQYPSAPSGYPSSMSSSSYFSAPYIPPPPPPTQSTGLFPSSITPARSSSYSSRPSMVTRLPSVTSSSSPIRAAVTTAASNAVAPSSTSSYTGYDAAVYAAATSYLQSKATGGGGGGGGGGGSNWLGMQRKTTGNRGSFPSKMSRGGMHSTGGVQQLHYCEVCKISCAGPQTYREHLEGQRHKKKEALLKGSAQMPLAKSKVSFRCDLCQVTCTGQDTYNAHVRGQKHLKTLKLHQTLGKPIPSNEPTMIAPSQPPSLQTPTMIGAGASSVAKKVIGVPQMNFIGGQKLTSTTSGTVVETTSAAASNDMAMQAALLAEQNVQPVGDDYVEPIKDHTGKLVQYFCKLCDCKFNDLNAKDMHLKGRRHRLQFKKKVNPDLEVEIKPNAMSLRMRRANDERQRKDLMRMRQQELWTMRAMYTTQMAPTPLFGANVGMPKPLFGGPTDPGGPRAESSDDRHVMAKHAAIYPTEEQLSTVQKLVIDTEKALKAVSDHFAQLEKEAFEAKKEDDATEKKDDAVASEERLLKGVMRVGLLAKGLLLRGDNSVSLVVLCSDLPTHALLTDIADLLPKQMTSVTDEQYDVSVRAEESCLLVKSRTEPVLECRVTLTSVLVRELAMAADGDCKKRDESELPAQSCLEALAELRHAKWFQARCSNLQSCLVTLRIMRDICQRIPTWNPLSIWACELLIEKVLTSCGVPLSPGDAIRRVFEAVAAGIMLPNGPGLLDPCEKEVANALNGLAPQQCEDITSSAQHALRLIAFNQLYKILAIERIPDRRIERKRPRESNGMTDEGNGKKDKKEEEAAINAEAVKVKPEAT